MHSLFVVILTHLFENKIEDMRVSSFCFYSRSDNDRG
jgi:hypothetical protein